MKKIFPLFFFYVFSSFCFGQSFHKNNFMVSLGYNIGIYGTTSEEKNNHTTKHDGAVSGIVPFTIEYAVSNHIGIGAGFRVDNFFSSGDTVRASSGEGFLLVSYHFFCKDNLNLFAGLKLGSSSFNYTNDNSGGEFNSNGSYAGLDFGANIYFSSHLGIFFNLAFTNFNYKDGTVTDVFGNDYPYSLALGGVNFGTGLTLKF